MLHVCFHLLLLLSDFLLNNHPAQPTFAGPVGLRWRFERNRLRLSVDVAHQIDARATGLAGNGAIVVRRLTL
jgi:hypothetical protein